jgi:Family of unknown function (DUF6519)
MKGDFTRFTYSQPNHYSRVLQQQGRVQLDADWNEQAEICGHRDAALAADLIGPCGAPRMGGGFEVSCGDDGELRLSAGRLYVAGTLCELEAETGYLEQPDLPGAAAISPAPGRTDLIYLDVWQRLITALEDPDIREPALGGSDTAVRARTVWQAKILRDVAVAGCEEPIEGWPPSPSDARLAVTIGARGQTPPSGNEAELSPTGEYPLLENALYRVEIHDGGSMGAATFKWSRENGSLVCAVGGLLPASEAEKSGVVVDPIGRDPQLALREGDWVEVLGERAELLLGTGTMARVTGVDHDQRIVWLDRDIASHAGESHLKLRRWEGVRQAVTEGPIKLEEGINVRFSGSSVAAGDYWAFPVRQSQPSVELGPSPPLGIRHYYCKLALLTWRRRGKGGWTCAVTDCRPLFAPLAQGTCKACESEIAELRAELGSQARHLRRLQARLG